MREIRIYRVNARENLYNIANSQTKVFPKAPLKASQFLVES